MELKQLVLNYIYSEQESQSTNETLGNQKNDEPNSP